MKKLALTMVLIFTLSLMVFSSHITAFAAVPGATVMNSFDSDKIDSDAWFLRSVKVVDNKLTATPGIVKIENGALKFAGAGDGCSFGPTGIYKDFTIRFDARVEEGSTFIGLAFGAKDPVANFWDQGVNMIYFQSATTDGLKDGKPLPAAAPGTDVGGGRGWTRPGYEQYDAKGSRDLTYKVVVKDGTATVYYKLVSDPESVLDTVRATFTGLGDTTGYVKICNTANANFSIDNLKIFPYEPVTNNFENSNIDAKQWNLKSVKVVDQKPTDSPGLVKIENGALKFSGAGDGCSFGPNAIYKNFTIRFDARVEEGSTFIGLSFGAKDPYMNFWDQGVDLIYFQVANTDGLKDGKTLPAVAPGTDVGGGRGWTRPGYEQYDAKGSRDLTYKVVVKDGTATVYYKLVSEPESVLDTARATFADLGDTTGYLKFCNTAGANFTIDNLRIDYNIDTTAAIPSGEAATSVKNATASGALSTSDITHNSIKAAWSKEIGAAYYKINVFTKGADNTYSFLKAVTVGDAAEADITGLESLVNYGLQLIAYDTNGIPVNYYALIEVKTKDKPAPPVITKSSDTTLASGRYKVDKAKATIKLGRDKADFKEFKSKISVAKGASYKILKADGKTVVTGGYILPNMKVRVQAENGKTYRVYNIIK